MNKLSGSSTDECEPLRDEPEQRYLLRLYVTGLTPRSTVAIAQTRSICEEHLRGHYDLEVIDVFQQPQLAQVEQIVVTPTLVKKLPPPSCRIVGDLSNRQKIIERLGLIEPADDQS